MSTLPHLTTPLSALACSLLLGVSGAALAGAHKSPTTDSTDHSAHSGHNMNSGGHDGHDMQGHSTEKDELGRRLFGMDHPMSPEMNDELRERIPLYNDYTDAEMALSMKMMGSDYAWYLSNDEVRGTQGVLILLHGFRDGDPLFKKEVEQFSDYFPTAMAPGMAMMMSDHIQLALDDLTAAGAETIAVVPVLATSHNEMMRQWEFIFGLRDEPAFATVKRVKTDARLLFAEPPGDDPLIAEMLLDHAMEISENPGNEVVIIAAHGPSFADDNVIVMEELANLAKIMREDGEFADVQGITLQDDAAPEIRDANVARLRGMVEKATADGKQVLVVTNLIGTRSIQSKLRKDLRGLEYKFNRRGLAEHPNFIEKWMSETVREQFERNPS